jgi:hypothetical protein
MRSVEVARHGPRPPIRLRPVPRCDPPFDDELEPLVWATAQQLAFDWSPPQRPAAAPTSPPDAARASPTPPDATHARSALPDAARAGTSVPDAARASAVAGASGDAKLAVRRFVSMCVEVLNGYRPPAHLRRLSRPAEAATIVAQGVAGARRVAKLRSARPADRRVRRAGPVGVIRAKLCEPRSGAVEAAVLLVTGERTWAMAIRLELHQQAWAATVLRLI